MRLILHNKRKLEYNKNAEHRREHKLFGGQYGELIRAK